MTKGSTTLPLKEGDEGNEMEHECGEMEVNEVREMDEEMNEESDEITSSNIEHTNVHCTQFCVDCVVQTFLFLAYLVLC